MSEYIIMDVFVHSNYETGEPDAVEVFAMQGKINMVDYYYAFEKGNAKDLAASFFEVSKQVDTVCKYLVSIEVERASEPTEYWVNVIYLIEML